MYRSNPRPKLSQGDIFFDIDLIDSAIPHNSPQKRKIIVLSHNCEIDKPNNQAVLTCGIRQLSEVNLGLQNDIRASRVVNCMYLPAGSNMGESFIDFRQIFRVNKFYLNEAMNTGFRLCSITDEAQMALTMSFYKFLSRREFKEYNLFGRIISWLFKKIGKSLAD